MIQASKNPSGTNQGSDFVEMTIYILIKAENIGLRIKLQTVPLTGSQMSRNGTFEHEVV